MGKVTLYLNETCGDTGLFKTTNEAYWLAVILKHDDIEFEVVPYPVSGNNSEHIQIEQNGTRFLSIEPFVRFLDNEFGMKLEAA